MEAIEVILLVLSRHLRVSIVDDFLYVFHHLRNVLTNPSQNISRQHLLRINMKIDKIKCDRKND